MERLVEGQMNGMDESVDGWIGGCKIIKLHLGKQEKNECTQKCYKPLSWNM